jgi:hypothetical protein
VRYNSKKKKKRRKEEEEKKKQDKDSIKWFFSILARRQISGK